MRTLKKKLAFAVSERCREDSSAFDLLRLHAEEGGVVGDSEEELELAVHVEGGLRDGHGEGGEAGGLEGCALFDAQGHFELPEAIPLKQGGADMKSLHLKEGCATCRSKPYMLSRRSVASLRPLESVSVVSVSTGST